MITRSDDGLSRRLSCRAMRARSLAASRSSRTAAMRPRRSCARSFLSPAAHFSSASPARLAPERARSSTVWSRAGGSQARPSVSSPSIRRARSAAAPCWAIASACRRTRRMPACSFAAWRREDIWAAWRGRPPMPRSCSMQPANRSSHRDGRRRAGRGRDCAHGRRRDCRAGPRHGRRCAGDEGRRDGDRRHFCREQGGSRRRRPHGCRHRVSAGSAVLRRE